MCIAAGSASSVACFRRAVAPCACSGACGGACGGDNDHRVVEAQRRLSEAQQALEDGPRRRGAKRKELEAAVKEQEKGLERAREERQTTLKKKQVAGAMGGRPKGSKVLSDAQVQTLTVDGIKLTKGDVSVLRQHFDFSAAIAVGDIVHYQIVAGPKYRLVLTKGTASLKNGNYYVGAKLLKTFHAAHFGGA